MRTIYRGRIFTFRKQANLQNLRGLVPDSLFIDEEQFVFLRDGALIVEDGKIVEIGDFHEINRHILPEDQIVEYRDKLITPGFIDSHMHSTQTSGVGAYGEKLLTWLENYIFPNEVAFNSQEVAHREFGILLNQLFKNGTTTICAYLPSSYDGADLLFEMVNDFNMRAIMGNTIMTDGNPKLITKPQTSLQISEKLYDKWNNTNRLSYALTPRFALSCSEETLGLCKEFLQSHKDAYTQSHLCENLNEIADTISKFPWSKDYLGVYEKYNLVHSRSIYGHCVHLSDSEFDRMKEHNAIFACCPSSNNYLGSGLFNYEKAIDMYCKVTLATDWGAGNSLSLFKVMDDSYKVAMLKTFKLETLIRWYCCTLGSAKALDVDKYIGSFEVGKEADFIVIDPSKNELLKYRLESSLDLLDYLFSIATLGDDRIIEATYVYGNKVYQSNS